LKNIELKIELHNFKEIKQRLLEIKAESKGTLLQVDTYYDYPDGRLKAREINKKEFVIIYYKRPNEAASKISNYKVYRFEKKDFAQIKKMFSDLCDEKVIVRKVRDLWIYKNTRIHLDNVNNLGNYLELETVVEESENIKRYQLEHKEIVNLLDIGHCKKLGESYSDMLLL
jgi:predicted adenylyl cyclase CyaB